jgi:signal transduction histidine kinase
MPAASARNACLSLSFATVAGGAASFAGWAFDAPRLTDWTGSGITIKTNTALLALASGVALLAWAVTPRLRAVTGVLGAGIALVAFLTLLQHLTQLDFGIDHFVYREAPGSPATTSPNRMGPPASSCFTAIGCALCLLAAGPRLHRLVIGIAIAIFALGMLSLTGYWYHAEAIYTLPKYTAIAPQTAAILVVMSLGLMTAFPDNEPTRTLFADDAAGALSRRLLPFLLGVPVVLGWLRLEGQRQGWYDSAFGTALRSWTEVAILASLAWWAIGAIRRREQARSAAEAALREADRRKDAFLATLAHELRNPLAPIRNSANILLQQGPLSPPLQWAAGVIERQVRHMTRLLDDLLDVSRITRERLELRRARIDVNDAVHAALEASRPLIEAARHDLQVALFAEPLPVDGDADRLAQVFLNLLNNAARYTPEGGHVAIATRREGEQAVVEVRDSGIGIEADTMPHLFEMFSQGHPALPQSQGGLGIGLSLSRGIVELHRGRIDVASDGAGRGSTFTVRLPCVA